MDNKEQAKAVHFMQEYIGQNLNTEITLKKLSAAAGYSPFHASRIFKEHTGYTLFEYIRKARLTEAAKRLRDGLCKVLDTALDFEFDSHEGFTRAFSKEFGISPYRYKKEPVPVKYFISYDVLIRWYSENKKKDGIKMTKTKTIFTQIIERPERKAIIKRGVKATNYYEYCEEVGCDVWGMLESVKEALYEPAGFWLPKQLIKPGTSEYVQGVEVAADYNGKIPDGFELIELKPCSMMVFQGEPYEDKDFEEAISEVWECIDKYNPAPYGYEWSDDAPRFQLIPQGYRGYIEARPVRKAAKPKL